MRDEKTLDEFNVRHGRMQCAAPVGGCCVVEGKTKRRNDDKQSKQYPSPILIVQR